MYIFTYQNYMASTEQYTDAALKHTHTCMHVESTDKPLTRVLINILSSHSHRHTCYPDSVLLFY